MCRRNPLISDVNCESRERQFNGRNDVINCGFFINEWQGPLFLSLLEQFPGQQWHSYDDMHTGLQLISNGRRYTGASWSRAAVLVLIHHILALTGCLLLSHRYRSCIDSI